MADPLRRVDCVRCGKQHVTKVISLFFCPECGAVMPESIIPVLLIFPILGFMMGRVVFFFVPVEVIETSFFVNSYIGQFLARSLTRFDSIFNWLFSFIIELPDTISMISIYGWQDVPSYLYRSLNGIGFASGLYIYYVVRYRLLRRMGWVYEKRTDSWFAINKTTPASFPTNYDQNTSNDTGDQVKIVDSKFWLVASMGVYKLYKFGDDLIKLAEVQPDYKGWKFYCPRCEKPLFYPSPQYCPYCNRDMQDFVNITTAPAFRVENDDVQTPIVEKKAPFLRSDGHFDFENNPRTNAERGYKKARDEQLMRAYQNLKEAQQELDYAIANNYSDQRIKEARNLVSLAEREVESIKAKSRGKKNRGNFLLNTIVKLISTISIDYVITCSSCNGQIERDARQCPHCGEWLSGIKCKDCGYEGREENFINNRCPVCDNTVHFGETEVVITESGFAEVEKRPSKTKWILIIGLIMSVVTVGGCMVGLVVMLIF